MKSLGKKHEVIMTSRNFMPLSKVHMKIHMLTFLNWNILFRRNIKHASRRLFIYL